MTDKIVFSYSANEVYSCDYPAQELKIEIPTTDLNVHQFFSAFRNFLRGIGFTEEVILNGALKMSTNLDNYPKEVVTKALEKQGLRFVEDCPNPDLINLSSSFVDSITGTYLQEDRIDNFPSMNYETL